MYLRLFSFFLFFNEKGFVNLILEWASPRLALNIAYSSDHTEKQKRGRIEVTAASAWTKWAFGITAFSRSGYRTLIYRKPRRCNLRLY